jgi:hypothetical protein
MIGSISNWFRDAIGGDKAMDSDIRLRERVRRLEEKAVITDARLAALEAQQADGKEQMDRIEETQELILKEVSTDPVALLLTCVTLNPTKFWGKGVKDMQLKSNQQATATVEAVDAEGNPAALPTPPTWESDTPGTVTVEVSPDGMSAVIGSPNPGPLGSAVVTVTAMVNGSPVSATLAVDIIAGDAVALNITTGAPVDV